MSVMCVCPVCFSNPWPGIQMLPQVETGSNEAVHPGQSANSGYGLAWPPEAVHIHVFRETQAAASSRELCLSGCCFGP